MNASNDKKLVIGCDIGNGYGYVSLLQDPFADPMPLLPSKYKLTDIGMPTTAFIVPPKGEDIVVFKDGGSAEKKYKKNPSQLVRAIKTRFKEGSIAIPGIDDPIKVEKIYSAIARDLLILAEEELQNKGIEPVYDIVFTFPAAFADDTSLLEMMQRNIESIQINGNSVHVVGRLPEPAAVAIDYLHYMQHLAPKNVRITKKSFTVLVYDLGHGTFDTAVVTAKSEGEPYILHSKDGLPELGGRNFDEIMHQEILSVLKEKYNYTPQKDRQKEAIRQTAVEAKIALTSEEAYTASILIEEEYYDIEITRQRFEELSQHLLFQSLELVQNVLEESKSKDIKIDCIVLSGGASKMPMVKNYLEQLVEGAYPIVLYRPSEAVSFGAARFACGITTNKKLVSNEKVETPQTPNPVMEQLTDRCYGIWLPAEGKLEGEISFIIPPGKVRPAKSEKIEIYSNSSHLLIKIYRSKEKNQLMKTASIEECDSMLWMRFDVEPDSKYEITITVLENYGVEVELVSEEGIVYKKSTLDRL